jgi:predicted metalloprotease with PDZ domain
MNTLTNRTLMLAALAAALATVPEARGQALETQCGEGQGPMLDIGIASLRFARANLLPVDERMIWSFTSEPSVVSVRPGGPADGKLEPDDRIISIDGQLITSAEGGRRWSGVGVGRTVTLVVRRGDREREVRIDASLRCQALPWRWPARADRGDRSLTLLYPTVVGDSGGRMYARALRDFAYAPRDTGRAYTRAQRDYGSRTDFRSQARLARVPARFRVLFGFGIFCADCAFESDTAGAPVSWQFTSSPSVTDVQDGGPAARAGLRVGDVIEAVDGAPITGEEGARRFSEAQPGRPVRFTVRRAGQNVTLEIVPAGPDRGVPAPDRTRRPD